MTVRRPDRPPWDDVALATLRVLWRLGWHQRRIAARLHKTEGAVRSMRYRLGLPKRRNHQRAKPSSLKA